MQSNGGSVQKRYSLKKRLILYVSVFSISLGCLLVFAAYRIALEEINEILDAQMQNLAERIATHGAEHSHSPFVPTQRYHEEDLFVDVWPYTGQQAHTTAEFRRLIGPKSRAGFYSHQTPADLWRIYVLPLHHVQVQISQQQSVRQRLALELAANMFIPYLLFMPLALWGLGWIINRNLKPLDDFRKEVAQREPHELKSVQSGEYPVEIVPVIHEINDLFYRIQQAQHEQRQFIADAAHELRTPITALNLQVQILLQNTPQSPALKNLSRGLVRIQHLVAQLMSLAQQDAAVAESAQPQHFDVSHVAVGCVEQLIQLALQKNIDLGMEQQDQVWMTGQLSSVSSIIFNLIDNAIKYTPEYGIINVSVQKQQHWVQIQVEDSGLGIDPQLYQKILQRFYRIQPQHEVGSGLGLAIVAAATQRLRGRLNFAKSDELGGLCVYIYLPITPETE